MAFKTNSQQPDTTYQINATYPHQNTGSTSNKIQNRMGPQIITGLVKWKMPYKMTNEEKVLLKQYIDMTS
jgi:hypothetical protein